VGPVVENLVVAFLEVFLARLHLDENALGPEKVGEFLAAFGFYRLAGEELELGGAGLLGDAEFVGGAGFDDALVAEGAEEVVEEGLGFAFFVALEVARELDELFERFPKLSGCHGDYTGQRGGFGQGEVVV
jgi:hypothetical protein